MEQDQVLQTPSPKNPYKKIVTFLSLGLNVAFLYFLWRFLATVFAFTPQGVRYVPPNSATAWIYLPFFILSAFLLLSSISYALLTRKTTGQEEYLWIVVTCNVIQVVISFAIIGFIVNTLACFSTSFFGIVVCVR